MTTATVSGRSSEQQNDLQPAIGDSGATAAVDASSGVHRIAGDHALLCDETVAVIEDELDELVERMFERSSGDVTSWPDPHPDRRPDDGEYSRVTNAKRYRILGARADAWADAAVEAGLAVVQDRVEWVDPPQTRLRRPYLVAPKAVGALPMVIARHRLGDCDDAGLTLGAGNPAVAIDFFPDCGCDACDSGSQDLLDVVDRSLRAIIAGRYRRLSKGDQVITVVGESRSSRNIDRQRADAVLREPTGWVEITGTSWLNPTNGAPLEP